MKYYEYRNFFFKQYKKIKKKIAGNVSQENIWSYLPNIVDTAFTNTFGTYVFFEMLLKFLPPYFGLNVLFNLLKYTTYTCTFFMTLYYRHEVSLAIQNSQITNVIESASEILSQGEEVFMQDSLMLEFSGFASDDTHCIDLKEDAPIIQNKLDDGENTETISTLMRVKKIYKNFSVPFISYDDYRSIMITALWMSLKIWQNYQWGSEDAKREKQNLFLKKKLQILRQKINELDVKLGTAEELRETLKNAKGMVNKELIFYLKDFPKNIAHNTPLLTFLELKPLLFFSGMIQGLMSAKGIHMLANILWPEWIIFNLVISIGALCKMTLNEYHQFQEAIQFQEDIEKFSARLNDIRNKKISIAEAIIIYQKEYLKILDDQEKETIFPVSFVKEHDTMRFFNSNKNSFEEESNQNLLLETTYTM
jgi:hypothetical protein